jgi:hypothetical protein
LGPPRRAQVVEAELAVLRADDDLRDQPVSPLS